MNPRQTAYLRACVGIGNCFGIALGYWICAQGATAGPLQSTMVFMFVLVGNVAVMAGLKRALDLDRGNTG